MKKHPTIATTVITSILVLTMGYILWPMVSEYLKPIRTVFTDAHYLGSSPAPLTIERYKIAAHEAADDVRRKWWGQRKLKTDIKQLSANIASNLYEVACYARDAKGLKDESQLKILATSCAKLSNDIERIESSIPHEECHNITRQGVATSRKYLQTAKDRILDNYERFFRYESGEQNENTLQRYQNFLSSIIDNTQVYLNERSIGLQELIKKRRRAVDEISDKSNSCSSTTTADALQPLLKYFSKEQGEPIPPILQSAALKTYKDCLPLAEVSLNDNAMHLANVTAETTRLTGIAKEEQYPGLRDFYSSRIKFLQQLERIIGSCTNHMEFTSNVFDTLTPQAGKECDWAGSRGSLTRFCHAWERAIQKENRLANTTSNDLIELIATWTDVVTNAPLVELKTLAQQRLELYTDLDAALAIQSTASSWIRLSDLRTVNFEHSPLSWRRLLHRLRRYKMPLAAVEKRQYLLKEAEQLGDTDEIQWATQMIQFLTYRQDKLDAKQLDSFSLYDLHTPLDNPAAESFLQRVAALHKVVTHLNRAEDNLQQAMLDRKEVGTIATMVTDVTTACNELVNATATSPWVKLANKRAELWKQAFNKNANKPEMLDLLSMHDPECRQPMRNYVGAVLFNNEEIEIEDVLKLKNQPQQFQNMVQLLESQGQKEVAAWYRKAAVAAANMDVVVSGADWLIKPITNDGTVPIPPDGWEQALASLKEWQAIRPTSKAAGATTGFEALVECKRMSADDLKASVSGDQQVQRQYMSIKTLAKLHDKLDALNQIAVCVITTNIGARYDRDIEAFNACIAHETEAQWDDALAAYRGLKPATVIAALFQKARIDRLNQIVNTHNYILKSGLPFSCEKTIPGFKCWGYAWVDVNQHYSGNNATWTGTKHNTPVFDWGETDNISVTMTETYTFEWKSPDQLLLHAGADGSRDHLRTTKKEGPNALRDFALDIGTTVQGLGFPYDWPTNETGISPIQWQINKKAIEEGVQQGERAAENKFNMLMR